MAGCLGQAGKAGNQPDLHWHMRGGEGGGEGERMQSLSSGKLPRQLRA